jgi:hypothetical protein
MIGVTLNGQTLELYPSMTVQIKRTNPMFSETHWEDGYSYSFTFPNSPMNRRVFYSNRAQEDDLIVVSFIGIEFIRGKLVSVKKTHESITANLIDESTDLRKKLEARHMDDLDLPSVVVCDIEDSALAKQVKWRNHMTETTFNTPPDQGAYKFPRIFTRSYSDWQADDESTHIHRVNNGVVNAHTDGEYLISGPVPISFDPQPTYKHWLFTISPCLRIQYVLDQMMEQIGVGTVISRLFDIPEFKQLISFSGYVLDQEEIAGSSKYNVHGFGFDLNDFLPDAQWISLFNMLADMFGAFYSRRNGELQILLIRDILNQKAVNFSRYCDPQYLMENGDNIAYLIKYPESEYQFSVWYYSDSLPLFPYNRIYPNADISINNEVDIADTEILFDHLPMTSVVEYLLFFNNFPDIFSGSFAGLRDFGTAFYYDVDFIRSAEFPDLDTERSTRFYPGVVRGMYPTPIREYDAFNSVIGTTIRDTLVQYNYNRLQISPETQAAYAAYLVDYGISSIYGSEDQNSFDLYLREFYELLSKSVYIQKELYLPAHVLLDLMKWKATKHVIQQKNLSFEGYVKDVSFTISQTGISPTTITYVVRDPGND